MTDIDNPEVGADAAGTEGLNQEAGLLGGETQQAAPQPTDAAPSAEDWRTTLPDDLKSAKSLQSIKSVEDLAKSYVNAQSVVGRRFEDLTPEQVEQYYGAMGRPESPDNYELEVPEGVQQDAELADWYKKAAFENGIPKESAEKLYQDYAQMEAEKVGQMEQMIEMQREEEAKQLKTDFGPAFDERVELANRALKEFGGDEAVQAIAEANLQNNPILVKMLANAGELLAEGKFTSGQQTGKFGMTSEEANQQITSLRSDPEFMKHYMNPGSDKHKEAASKMQDLYKIKVNTTA